MIVVALVAIFATYEAIIHQPEEKIPGVTTPAASLAPVPAPAVNADMLVALHQSNMRIIPAAQMVAGRTDDQAVKDPVAMLANERQALEETVTSTARSLGVTLPTAVSGAPIDGSDTAMVNTMRNEQGDLLKDVIADRLTTNNDQVREFDNIATLALERGISYTEATNLIDYGAPSPAGTVVAVLDRTTITAAIAALTVIVVLSVIFIRLLLRRNRRPVKGTP